MPAPISANHALETFDIVSYYPHLVPFNCIQRLAFIDCYDTVSSDTTAIEKRTFDRDPSLKQLGMRQDARLKFDEIEPFLVQPPVTNNLPDTDVSNGIGKEI